MTPERRVLFKHRQELQKLTEWVQLTPVLYKMNFVDVPLKGILRHQCCLLTHTHTHTHTQVSFRVILGQMSYAPPHPKYEV